MIEAAELTSLESAARTAGVTMNAVCEEAGKHSASWYRARKRGKAHYTLIDPLWAALRRIAERGDNS